MTRGEMIRMALDKTVADVLEQINYEELKVEVVYMYQASYVWQFPKRDYCPWYCSR